jgi:peptidoglycan/xylan/chitin deacetylase (PgdA/CDA1 family)
VVTGRIGTPGFLAADEVRELAGRGHAIVSHSHTHPTYMGRLTPAQVDEEWRVSRELLAELLGEPPPLASVPGGFLSRAVIDGAASAGYRVLLTSEPVVRLRFANRLLVLGRFTIWASTPPSRAGAYVRGAWGPRSRLWLEWNAKKLAQLASPDVYESLRRRTARS